MNRLAKKPLIISLFVGFGSLAVVAGGLLSAFSANNPTRLAMWTSAYLVLVVGVMQILLGIGAYLLVAKPSRKLIISAFIVYNLGNLGVIVGTILKNSSTYSTVLVDIGGLLLAVAMLLLLILVRKTRRSLLQFAYFAAVAVLLVSMPIGLFLAHLS